MRALAARAAPQEPLGTRFQVGGTLRAGSIYVPRPADQELPEALMAGEFCYVLAPRQIGKSSLRVRARRTLEARGVACASIDLTQIGSRDSTHAEWYYDLTDSLARQLALGDMRPFWAEREGLSPLHRWSCFLREHVLARVPGRVVVFIDELDAVLALPRVSRDDFFAAVRAVYNARADDDAFERLTFCLIGVALPGDLIADETRTPFNIGRAITLEDFARAEMDVMGSGLQEVDGEPRALLDAVFEWTHGHPYMTQKLCEALVDMDLDRERRSGRAAPRATPRDRVRHLVGQLFLQGGEGGAGGRVLETNLANAEKYFLKESRSPLCVPMLALYGRLRAGENVLVQRQDPVQMALRLTGMAAERRHSDHGDCFQLRVRNPIFAKVFNPAWVATRQAERYLAAPLARWLESGRSDDYLLRGEALQEAYRWFRGREDVAPEEFAFVMAGLEAARREEEARARARAFRALWALGATVALTVVIAGAGLFAAQGKRSALRQAARLQEEARQAEYARRHAQMEKEKAAREKRDAERTLVEVAKARQRAELERAAAAQEVRRSRDELGVLRAELLQARDTISRAEVETQEAEAVRKRAQEQAARARMEEQRADRARALVETLKRKLDAGWVLPAAALWPVGDLVFGGPVYAAGFSPDGRWVVGASADGTARLWELGSGRAVALRGHEGPVRFAAFSPQGRLVITAGQDRSAAVWEAGTGQLVSRLVEHPGPIMAAVFSPNGAHLVTISSDKSARIWDVRSGLLRTRLLGHRGPVYAAAVAPDGRLVATASWDGSVRLWALQDGQLLSIIMDGEAPLRSVAFSPDGTRLAAAGDDGVARVFDVHSGHLLWRLRGHEAGLNEVRYAGTGRFLITASDDRTARLWEATTGRLHAVLLGHHGPVLAVAFSPDGGRVVTASQDRTARVWDVGKGQALLELPTHGGPVLAVGFSPDGGRVVTASSDHRARVFPGSLRAWVEGGCNLAVQRPGAPVGELDDLQDPHDLKDRLCKLAAAVP